MPYSIISNKVQESTTSNLPDKEHRKETDTSGKVCKQNVLAIKDENDDILKTAPPSNEHSTDSDFTKASTEKGEITNQDPTQATLSILPPKSLHPTSKEQTFPEKLHWILSNPQFVNVVTWLPHGRSWKIVNHKALEDKVIPLYFNNCKPSSFTRKLSVWGFKRITKGTDRDSFYNDLFLRGSPNLCKRMRRLPSKERVEEDEDPPKFHRMPPPDVPHQLTPFCHSNVIGDLFMRRLAIFHRLNQNDSSPVDDNFMDIRLAQDVPIVDSSGTLYRVPDTLFPTNEGRASETHHVVNVDSSVEHLLSRHENACNISHAGSLRQCSENFDSSLNNDDIVSRSHGGNSNKKSTIYEKLPTNQKQRRLEKHGNVPCLKSAPKMELPHHHLTTAHSKTNDVPKNSMASECVQMDTEKTETKLISLEEHQNNVHVSKSHYETTDDQSTDVNANFDRLRDHDNRDDVSHTNARPELPRSCTNTSNDSPNLNNNDDDRGTATPRPLPNLEHLGLEQHDGFAYHISDIGWELLRRRHQNATLHDMHILFPDSNVPLEMITMDVPTQDPCAATHLSTDGVPIHSSGAEDTLSSIDFLRSFSYALNPPPGHRMLWVPYELKDLS